MTSNTVEAVFHRETDPGTEEPTLIEELPGHELVASIAVDQITDRVVDNQKPS